MLRTRIDPRRIGGMFVCTWMDLGRAKVLSTWMAPRRKLACACVCSGVLFAHVRLEKVNSRCIFGARQSVVNMDWSLKNSWHVCVHLDGLGDTRRCCEYGWSPEESWHVLEFAVESCLDMVRLRSVGRSCEHGVSLCKYRNGTLIVCCGRQEATLKHPGSPALV